MADEVPIRIEPGGTGARGGSDGRGDWSGPGASSRRVVHEPNRWTRSAAVVVLAGLVAGGLLLSLGGGGKDGHDERRPLVSAPEAYTAAVARLGRARSFAYSGTVHATDRSPLRPGAWLDDEVRIEGAVLLPHSITREVAYLPGGGVAVQTVTSGPTAWSRTASSMSALPGRPWELVAWTDPEPWPPSRLNPESFGSNRLGIALVADVLRSARDRRGHSDADGHRVLQATVPMDENHRHQVGDLAGTEVELLVDEAGDVTDVTLTAPPADDDAGLVVELAIDQLGEADLISLTDVSRAAGSALPVADIAAAGVHPLGLSWLPSGWALTDAQEARTEPVVMCGTGTGGCTGPDESCPTLDLEYRDLTAISDGRLSLSVRPDSCYAAGAGSDAATGEAFRAGRFTGWVEESSLETIGTMSDGETTVRFTTDLSADDAGAVLATLVPFDAATEPAVLPGVPSS